MSSTRTLAAAVTLLALRAAACDAQVYASERGVVSQTVNGTTVTVEYYRPRARGRELFGKLVPWEKMWTPGANWATTLEVDHDVTLEGQPLPKGKYSVWAVPKADAWTIVVSRTARLFHTRLPDSASVQLRATVAPIVGPHAELLTFSFPAVTRDSLELLFQWGTTGVALRMGIGAGAVVAARLGDAERARYVGTYRMTNTNPRARVKTHTFTVFDSLGVLRLRRSDPPDTYYDAQFDLHHAGEHTFQPIMYRDGALVGVEPAMTILFTVEGARATALEMRFANGNVMARGVPERPSP